MGSGTPLDYYFQFIIQQIPTFQKIQHCFSSSTIAMVIHSYQITYFLISCRVFQMAFYSINICFSVLVIFHDSICSLYLL